MWRFSNPKYLAGTVSIPIAFPEVIRFALAGDTIVATDTRPFWEVVRTIQKGDVAAVFVAQCPEPDLVRRDWHDTKNWKFVDELKEGEEVRGILYVREHAPVLMKAEFGMIAAESAEYAPAAAGRVYWPCCEGVVSHKPGEEC